MQINYLNGVYKFAFIIAIAFFPQFAFLGSYINNDSLALFAISIIIYAWINALETRWDLKSCILLGAGMGICALSYYNAYGYLLISFILYIVTSVLNKVNIKEFFKKGVIIAGITFIIAGWWFIRSAIIYDGDFLGLKTQDEYAEKYALPKYKPSVRETPQREGQSLWYMLIDRGWLKLTYCSFIAVFGYMNIVPNHRVVYQIYIMIYFLAMAGMLMQIKNNFIYKNQDEKGRNKVILNYSFTFAIIIPILLSIYYSYTSDFQAQGRYIMPMLIPFYYFVIKGITNVAENVISLPKIKDIKNINTIKNTMMILFMIGIVIICFYCLFRVNMPYYEINSEMLNEQLVFST